MTENRTPGRVRVPLPADREGEPPDAAARLRVGVLLEGEWIPRWQLVCLSEIARAPFCELIVFVPGSSPWPRRGSVRHLLYHAYERADRRRFAADDDPLALVVLGEGLRGTSATRVAIRLDPDGHCSPRGVADISSERLDVLVCLSGAVDLSELAPCARHGVWCLYVGAARGRPDEAPLFWETFSGDGLSVTTLWTLEEGDGGRAIYRSNARTDPVSVHRNRLVSYRKAAHLPLRALRSLHQGSGSSMASVSPGAEQPGERKRAKPTNAQMVRFFWRLGRQILGHRLHDRLFEEQWYLAYRRRDPAPPTAEAEAAFTTIMPPPGRYYADPFLLQRDGRHFLFFEEYLYATQRGLISYVEIDDEGRHSTPRLALQRDYHLSYPFLQCEGDVIYLVPETGSHGTIEVYRTRRFPGHWELERVLLEGIDARDPTLLHHQGMYWLFAAVAVDGGSPPDELFLFFSDSLLGEWRPHPMNPIVSDVGSARPAGRIFTRNGQLIRPAQDCSRAYGGRIVLHRIEQLDVTGYREVPVGRIEPVGPKGSLRTHTYNEDGLYETVDGFRRRLKISLPGPDWGEPDRMQRFRIELDA